MSFQPRGLEAALCAAVGDDLPLIAELRAVFFQSAAQALATLGEARTPAEWSEASTRLVSLAASFGAFDLLEAARAAESAGRGEAALARVRAALDALDS